MESTFRRAPVQGLLYAHDNKTNRNKSVFSRVKNAYKYSQILGPRLNRNKVRILQVKRLNSFQNPSKERIQKFLPLCVVYK